MLQRRTLLGLGLASLGLVAAGAWSFGTQPAPWTGARFSQPASRMMASMAEALLQGLLDLQGPDKAQLLQAHLHRLEAAVAGLPPPTQGELARLLMLLLIAPGRLGLAGLSSSWEQARPAEVAVALQKMRTSSLSLRRQAYQALRDLHFAAWAAEPANWRKLRYPGPMPIA